MPGQPDAAIISGLDGMRGTIWEFELCPFFFSFFIVFFFFRAQILQVTEEEQAQMEIMLEIPLTVWKLIRVSFTHLPGHPGLFTLSRLDSFISPPL